jgi:hypothetical protein
MIFLRNFDEIVRNHDIAYGSESADPYSDLRIRIHEANKLRLTRIRNLLEKRYPTLACSLSSSDMCSVLVLVTISTLLAANTCNKGNRAVLLCKSWFTDLGYVEVPLLYNIFLSRNFCERNNLIKVAEPVGPKHFVLVETEKEKNRFHVAIWSHPEWFIKYGDKRSERSDSDPIEKARSTTAERLKNLVSTRVCTR